MPFPALGSMHEATTMTNSRMNSMGMSNFEARSMPWRMPRQTTKWQRTRMATVQNTGMTGDDENASK